MKKTVLMNAAKKARIALAVMVVCGMSFVGAQSAFAAIEISGMSNTITDAKDSSTVIGTENKLKGGVIDGENTNFNVLESRNALTKALDSNGNLIYGDNINIESSYKNGNAIFGYNIKLSDYAYDSVVVGSDNELSGTGAHAVVVGKNNKAASYWGVTIGYESELGSMSSVVVGSLSKATCEEACVFGTKSKATGKYSVALGSNSTADEDNTVSVGGMHEVQIGNKPTGEPIMETQWLKRRITNVADGTRDTDAATVGQVKSMIAAGGGASFDGTKLNTDIQNVDVAGGYKDTATNPNADTKGTVAGAINSAYQAGKEYTDTKVSAVEGKLNTLKTNVDQNTTDISNIKTNIGDMSKLDVNGKNNLVDAVNEAYKAATSAGANVGKLDELTTTNRDNLVGAVNEVNKKADKAQTTADNALNKANDAQTTANSALNKANANENKIGDLNSLTTTEKGNLVGAVNEVNNKVGTADELKALKDAGLGDNLAQATAAVNKKADKNAEDIKNVNGRVDELGGRVDTLGGAVSKLDSRVNKVGAGAAALAALHPMEFDSDNKLSFAAGVGNYRGTNAAAIGAFYRPSEQVMFSISGNMGNGENMVNAGVSFALDRPIKTPTTKAALVKTVVAQNEQIAALNETVAEQNEKIARLEAMVEKLAAKQNA